MEHHKISLDSKIFCKKLQGKSYSSVIDLENKNLNLLENLFGNDPVLFRSFLSDNFQKQPVVLKGSQERISKISSDLFDLNVKELISNTASEQIHVWLSTSLSESTLESISVDDPAQASLLYQAGHSLYCRAPLSLEKSVILQVVNEIGFGVYPTCDKFTRGEIELFFSRKGHVTNFHTDFQENFTIQLSGIKKWTFASSSAISPLRGCTPQYSTSQGEDLFEQQLKVLRLGDPNFTLNQYSKDDVQDSILLSPGDVLYHPAGIWHRVECTEDSISLNVSVIGSSYAEIVCCGLQQLLWKNSVWRGVVRRGDEDSKTASRQVVADILAKLPDLLKSITSRDLLPSSALDGPDDHLLHTMTTYDDDSNLDNDFISVNSDNETAAEETADDTASDETVDESTSEDDEGGLSHYMYLDRLQLLPTVTPAAIEAVRMKLNPLSSVLSDACLAVARDAPLDEIRYIVNCSFGNETLESVSRRVLVCGAEDGVSRAVLGLVMGAGFRGALSESKRPGGKGKGTKKRRRGSNDGQAWADFDDRLTSVRGVSAVEMAQVLDLGTTAALVEKVFCVMLALEAAGALSLCE